MITGRAHQVSLRARRMLKHDVAKDTGWGTGLQLLSLIVSLATFTLLGRRLGPVFVGTYAGIYAVLGPLIGLSTGCKMLYLQITKDDHADLELDAERCLGLVLMGGAVLVGIVAVVAPFVVDQVSLWIVIALAVMELLGHVTAGVVAAYVWTLDGYVAGVKIEMVQTAMRLVPVVALTLAGQLSLANIALSSLVLTIGWVLALFVWVRARYGTSLRPRSPSLTLARQSATFSVGITATGLQNDSDKAFLNSNGYIVDAGYYSAAYRIVQMGLLPVVALTGSSHLRFLEHDRGVPGTHLRRAVHFALPAIAYSSLVAVGLWLFAPYLHYLIGDDFGPSVGMLRWLVLFLPLRASWTIAVNALLGLDRAGLRTIVLILSAVISITLYAVLIPSHSWKGAVAGTILSELILAVVCWGMVVSAQRARIGSSPKRLRPFLHDPPQPRSLVN